MAKNEETAYPPERTAGLKPAMKAKVLDISVIGDPEIWKLISQSSSELQGWIKSTRAMAIQNKGVLVQTSWSQRNDEGTYSLSESLQFIPGVAVKEEKKGNSIIYRLG